MKRRTENDFYAGQSSGQARRAPYQQDGEAPPQPAQAAEAEDLWALSDMAFNPAPWQEDVPPAAAAEPAWYAPAAYPSVLTQDEPYIPRPRRRGGWLMLLTASLLLLGGMLYAVYAAYQPYALFQMRRDWMQRSTYFDGVVVDGVHLGGMTREEAALALSGGQMAGAQALNLTLRLDGRAIAINEQQIPYTRNTQAVLAAAYAFGRQNQGLPHGGAGSPFEARFAQTQQALAQKVQLTTASTYDQADVRRLVEELARATDREPVNAMIATFDFNTRQFTVTQDAPGAVLDQEALTAQLTQWLDGGARSGEMDFASQMVPPQVTGAALSAGFGKLAAFTTTTTKDELRNTNIRLAAAKLHGATVMPGDTFSFNKTVGARTSQGGYQMAPAISGGVMNDEIGGGVCQVSSTLFNTAAMAGMQIVRRSPHAWPSSYIDKGLDATVNWPDLDFKFKNDKQTPVFIVAAYEKRKLTVEFYGLNEQPGQTVELDTRLISTTQPPAEPLYQQNPALPQGTRKQIKKARPGYVVETWRIYKRDGQEYQREKLFNSTYKMVQEVIEYN